MNLPLWDGESLAGYLLRLAEANGYTGIKQFLKVAAQLAGNSAAEMVVKLSTSLSALQLLGRVTVGDSGHLLRFYSEPLPQGESYTEALFFQDCRIDVDALAPTRSPVCPICLRKGYASESWDLAPVVACSAHRVCLIDECICGTAIDWNRPSLLSCKVCLQDFRHLAVQKASDQVVATADDFSALAPFWFGDAGSRRIEQWDDMFRVMKLLLVPINNVIRRDWPDKLVGAASVKQRAEAIAEIADCRLYHGSYDLRGKGARLKVKLSPLAAIPNPGALEAYLSDYMIGDVGLSPHTVAEMLDAPLPEEFPSAASVFKGRVPSVSTVDQIAEVYETKKSDARALLELGIVGPLQRNHVGYDADEIIRGRKYISSLVPLLELSKYVGVEVTGDDLKADGLFPRWNRLDTGDHRVPVERLLEIQLRLIQAWHGSKKSASNYTLRDLAMNAERPFALVATVVTRIVQGSIADFDWQVPYSWTDLCFGTDVGQGPRE